MLYYIKKAYHWFYRGTPSDIEKEAILNVKIINKKLNSNTKLKASKPEKELEELIKNKGLVYCREYSFKDLIGTYKPLRFDFAIIYNERLVLVEFQGSQHYIFPNGLHKKKEDFDNQKKSDEQKKEYCKKHNIKLIEFDYLQTRFLKELFDEHFP